MPNRLPEAASEALKELTWHIMIAGRVIEIDKLAVESNSLEGVQIRRETAAKGPIHLAAHALRLASKLEGNVIAVGYLDEYRSGYVAISGLPTRFYPSDFVAICKVSYGLTESCNDPSSLREWREIVGNRDLIVKSVSMNDAVNLIIEVLRREGKLVR